MADGKRFNPNSDVAASMTLPLGTTAKATNLSNGKIAMVKVADRGPYRAGRLTDQLAMKRPRSRWRPSPCHSRTVR
jgi:rare lipoprotein A